MMNRNERGEGRSNRRSGKRRAATLVFAMTAMVFFARSTAAEEYIFAVTTDYETSGQCATIDMDSPWSAETNLEPVSSDPVVRFYRNLIYVVNRLYADNIQVLDPDLDFDTILEFSVGAGSNPQDIAFVSENRAYVSRYESAWLYEVNPSTGAILDSIDLSLFADADGIPEQSRMVLYDDRLFVQIQRINRSTWTPVPPSLLAVIDVNTNQIIDADGGTPGVQGIVLTGMNPTGEMVLDEEAGMIYVGEVGSYFVQDGGIDMVDADALAATGFLVPETELGGDIGVFSFGGASGFATVSDDWFYMTRIVSFSIPGGSVTDTLYTTNGFIPDMECDTVTSQLFVADRKETAPGVHVFDTGSGVKLNGSPINTGLPPADLVVVRPIRVGVAGAEESEMFRSGRTAWAQPNPFQRETRIFLRPGGGPAEEVSIFDIRGRRVRLLAGGEAADAGVVALRWDGRDEGGRPVAPGVYFFRQAGLSSAAGRVIIIR